MKSESFEECDRELVLIIARLGRRFGINCSSAFLKIFKSNEGDFSQKSPEPNMRLLVNHTKPTVVSDLHTEAKGSRFESGCYLWAEVSSLQ